MIYPCFMLFYVISTDLMGFGGDGIMLGNT